MSRTTYGNTWWGRQWLQALAHIDYDNRLPRGRTYANKGAVRDLAIKVGTVTARVQGSRPQPYQVTVAVPPLAAKDATRLLDRLAADPSLIARLLNRELDPGVLDAANALGLAIFPTRWRDLDMRCSCPDSAVPCKHLAAVVYLLSREIDGDPFLVFSLRGLDLVQALGARDVHIEAAAGPPTLAELLADGAAAHEGAGDPAALDRLDFCAVPDLTQALWRVLPVAPAFFAAGDFRETAQRVLTRVAKAARQALGTAATDAEDDFDAQDRPRLVIDAAGVVTVSGLAAAAPGAGVVALADRLGRLAPHRLADLQPEVAALHTVRLFALHLLARGAVVPQVHAIDGGGMGLRWLPATLDAAVSSLLRQLGEALPAGLVSFVQGVEARPKASAGKRRTVVAPAPPLSAAAQAGVLCSVFLAHFIHAWSDVGREKAAGDQTLALFFATGRACFDGPGEGSIAAGIQTWLSRLHVARRDVSALLLLEEGAADDFALTLAVERVGAAEPPVALSEMLRAPRWAKTRYTVLQQVAVLAEFFPPLAGYMRAGAAEPLSIAAAELPGFLFETLPAVRLLGVRALLPKALDRLLRPRLSMRLSARVDRGRTLLGQDDVLSFDWQVALGDQVVSRAEFERLVRRAVGIVRFKGEYVFLDPAEIERLRARLDRPPPVDGAELLRTALAGEWDGAPVRLDARAQRLVQQLLETGDAALPAGLQAELRPYQRRGYAWLWRNAHARLGSVIADDMGLGKTLQVIAVLLRLKQDGELEEATALVVVPTSLLTNWQKELARFAPALSVGVFHGARRELAGDRPDVLLTSYGVVRSEAARLKALAWRLLVVDEAQNLKNPAAAQTRAVKHIPAGSCIAMSGTPVENRLVDYWSIMDFAHRGYLGSLSRFVREVATPIQARADPQAAERFRRVTAPFLLRRLKSDRAVIDDLPAKIEQNQYCTLTPAQTALYESVVQEGLASLEGVSETFTRQGLVLQMILALKQVCNHPAQYLKSGDRTAALSGKAERLLELAEAIHDAGEKALVFTQFRETGELLADWLAGRHGRRPQFLHGGVPRKERDAMVERFQGDRTERVFLLSLKAGGTGLNLTAASSVIHFDLWWNPAVEAQATDRAYRIGQRRAVQVHRLITRATFEERIDEMIRAKRDLAELTVGTGEQWIGQLPAEELRALFELA